MIIDRNAWHYRVYQWWLQHSWGNEPGYKENLCHYFWVIVLQAPLTWIGGHSPTTVLKRIFTCFCIAYVVAVVIGLVGGIIYLAITDPITLAIVAGCIIGGTIITVVVTVVGVTVTEGRRLEIPGTVKLIGGYIAAKKHRICPFIEVRT